jgi:hypothetical protein
MRRALVMGFVGVLAAVALTVAIAQAQKGPGGGPGGPPPCTDPIPAEIQAKLLADFGEKGIDADKGGTLTCAEVKAFFDANPSLRPPRPCGPPPCVDPIPAEIQARLLADFGEKGIDANGDGTLTCAEVKAFFDANPSLRPPPPGGPCGGPPPGPPPCAGNGTAGAKSGSSQAKAGSSASSGKASTTAAKNGKTGTNGSSAKKK